MEDEERERERGGNLPVCLKGIFCKGHGVSNERFAGMTDIRKSSF